MKNKQKKDQTKSKPAEIVIGSKPELSLKEMARLAREGLITVFDENVSREEAENLVLAW